jgi:phenylpyruvate tautomerase PptA (4-oxalocrotonate tautomerase family)
VPHVIVKLWPGKSEQQKNRLADKIAKDVIDVFDYGEESVSVAFEEVRSQGWKKKSTNRISRTSGTSSTRNLDTKCKSGKESLQMAKWEETELRKIAEADDLHIAPFRDDAKTYGTPTWIWSVAVGAALYVRGYNGTESRWYKAALRQKAGGIIAAGLTKEVSFEPVDGPINESIDDAYRLKYGPSPYLKPMIAARARAATVKIMPRDTNG